MKASYSTIICALCADAGLPLPCEEVWFARPRRWRLDFGWLNERVAIEVDGGAWLPAGGRHGRGVGFVHDLEKRRAAVLAGWRVLHYTPQEIRRGIFVEDLKLLLSRRV